MHRRLSNTRSQQRILKAWEHFVSSPSRHADGAIRPLTLQAWNRCVDLGINPEKLEFAFLSEVELQERRHANAELIRASLPYLEILSRTLTGRPHVVALADRESWILELKGTQEAFGGRHAGIDVGASWSERKIGNNGVGTALATESSILIHGVEHYARPYHPATCLGVPIRQNGEVVGCIDVSVLNEDADPDRMVLAQACVESIEETLAVRARDQRQTSDSALQGLLATNTHDLRNALTVVRVVSGVGLESSKDERQRALFGRIVRQTEEMVHMLNVLLTDWNDAKVPASPCALLEEVVSDVETWCEAEHISVEFTSQCTESIELRPNLFKRAMQNLVGNAIQSMKGGGKLALDCHGHSDFVRISVTDTGPGIPKHLQEALFEPFVSGRADGTGLGLYQVREAITTYHGGRLWFDTREGRGTTFFVDLPSGTALSTTNVA